MTLTAAAADDIIAAAIKRAEAIGKEIGIAVVDADGAVLSARRSEEVRSLTLHLATAKAYSAAVMETPTRRLDAWQQTRPVLLMQLSQLGPHPVVPGDGGIPVRRDGRVIGGVGMSGARGEEDRICEEVLDSLGYELDRD